MNGTNVNAFGTDYIRTNFGLLHFKLAMVKWLNIVLQIDILFMKTSWKNSRLIIIADYFANTYRFVVVAITKITRKGFK